MSGCDAETAYCFSLARAVASNAIEIMVSDQLNHVVDDVSMTLSKTVLLAKFSHSEASALDGYHEYAITFHPESQDIGDISEALQVISHGKSGLALKI